jgi:hypothetical protein
MMETTMTTTTSTAARVQTIVQKVVMVSLDAFNDASALAASYKSSIATGASTSATAVQVTINQIVIKVRTVISGSVTASHLSAIAQAFATRANVPASSVTVEVVSRRRLRQAQDSADGSNERRLSSLTVDASIVADNATDVIAAAKTIHAAVSNSTALASAIASSTGVSVTAQATATFEVSVTAMITTSATLNTATINSAVASGLNGTVTLVSFESGAGSTVATVAATAAAATTADGTNNAPMSSGSVLVAFMSLLFAVTKAI